jgi:hypothetical protein
MRAALIHRASEPTRNEMPCTSPAATDACRPANLYGLSVIRNAQSTTKKYSECIQIVDDGTQ